MRDLYYFPDLLKQKLEQIIEYPLTVIEADSGYGKTTAVYEYLLKKNAENCVQMTYSCLGESSAAAWKGICSELSAADEETARYLSSLDITTAENYPEILSQIRNLDCRAPLFLCIDNFQLLDIQEKDRFLEALSLHKCRNLHIVVMTTPYRSALDATHWKKYGINCITADFLSFSRDDIRMHFQQNGIRLSAAQLDCIWNTTEGYPAAICLQLESMERQGQPEEAAGIIPLMEKVFWCHRNEAERSCLLRLSMLDQFSVQQGFKLISIKTSDHAVLSPEEFEDFLNFSGFIRFRSETDTYVLHHLLLSFLREKFRRLDGKAKTVLWQMAAETCRESGDYIHAAGFYSRYGDYGSLVKLPFARDDRVALAVMENGRLVKELIDPAFRGHLKQNPELALSLALELYMLGNISLHRQYLAEVDRLLALPDQYDSLRLDRLRGDYALMESFFAFNDVDRMCGCHRRAYQLLQGPTRLYSLNTAWTFGMPSVVCMFYREPGKLDLEYSAVRDGLPDYYSLSDGNGKGAPHAMAGEIHLLRGNDRAAEKEFRQALYEAEQMEQDSICYCAYLGLARIAILRGDTAACTYAQENIKDRAYRGKESRCVFTTAVCEAYIGMLLDQNAEIPQWLHSRESISRRSLMFAVPFVHIIYGKLLLEQLKNHVLSYRKFEIEIQQLIDESRHMNMLLPVLYFQIYLTIGADMQGEREQALNSLHETLNFAAVDGIIFPFAENYKYLKSLLETAAVSRENRELKEKIFNLTGRYRRGRDVILNALNVTNKILTPREREIAGLLKIRLSVKEIAEKLFISKSTVSNIMQSIYGKLNIHSKRELYFREDI